MSRLERRGLELYAKHLIIFAAERLVASSGRRMVRLLDCGVVVDQVRRPLSLYGAHLLLGVRGHYAKLVVAAHARAQQRRATPSARGGLQVKAGRFWRLLAVVYCVARMAEQREHLANVTHRIVFGRLDAHRVRVTTKARYMIRFAHARNAFVVVHQRQVVLAIALETTPLATV